MRIDLLKKLHSKEITLDEVYNIYDSVMDSEEPSIKDAFMLSAEEWQAFVHGAGFENLEKWRYKGWPKCSICQKSIDIAKEHWRVVSHKVNSEIKHLNCKLNETK